MEKDLISRKSLIDKLENEFCSSCPTGDRKCRRDQLLKIIEEQPSAYDADWVERRLSNMFKHHTATKTVQRLVLETVQDGYCAAADKNRE